MIVKVVADSVHARAFTRLIVSSPTIQVGAFLNGGVNVKVHPEATDPGVIVHDLLEQFVLMAGELPQLDNTEAADKFASELIFPPVLMMSAYGPAGFVPTPRL